MNELTLMRLFPQPAAELPVAGLYLSHRLHARSQGLPYVYGSFVSSLDGRIALVEPDGQAATPPSLLSPADWQLLQELHAQADCIVTHSGYLRALQAGQLGNLLQVTAPDLQAWRLEQGLQAQPAIVVASSSLEFKVPDSIGHYGQPLHIVTGEQANKDKIHAWQQQGYSVALAGNGVAVEGAALYQFLADQGYRSIYLLAGPQMLGALLRASCLARLYLTLPHQLIGGAQFHTMIEGGILGAAGELELCELYLQSGRRGQFFGCFEPS